MSETNVLAGRYELIEKIGDGGMAVVYKAKCRLLKRFVAVKILKPEYTKDIKFVENFRRESHATASLSHPNIVSIYDVGQEGNVNYIVMELVDGMTLSELIEEAGSLDYKKAIYITKQIAAGLSVAHKNGIIHRDVKPHNILITKDGIAKLTDFGIAKAVSNTTIVDTSKEGIMGSVHYFSPEQAKGINVDERSDLYSLGIVLFEMLTGRVPFDGDNPVTVALMQINEPITSPSVYNHNIPPSLENVVLKATEKNPEYRFQTADEMKEALEDVETVGRVTGASAFAAAKDYSDASTNYIPKSYNQNDYEDDYFEDEYDQKPRKPKQPKRKGSKKKFVIIGAVIALLAVAFAVLWSMGLFEKKDIEVPDFTGMKIEEAEKLAAENNLSIEIGKYENSDKYAQDEIMDQDPDDGTKVAKDTVITVDISKGGKVDVIPNVVGKNEEDAKKMIEQYGFKVGTVKEKESPKKQGTVLSQDPSAGSEGREGDEINIVVSDGKGKELATVPSVLGMTKAAAKKALENAGFKLGQVSTGVSSQYGDGEVMWQEYNSGTKLEKGETVNIKISSGKKSTISFDIPFDQAQEEVFYMTVTVTDDSGTRNVISNKRCSKSDGSTTIDIEGTGKGTVTVTFDGNTVMKKSVDFSAGDVG